MATSSIVLILAAVVLTGAAAASPPSDAPQAPRPAAETFRTYPVVDLQGRPADLDVLLRGKVGLVTFWATWCPPCLAEGPRLAELSSEYRRQGLVVVGVGFRLGGDTPAKQRRTASRLAMLYHLVFDQEGAFESGYGVTALPRNFLVGRDGTIRWRGAALPENIEDRVQALLAEAGPAGDAAS